MRSSRTPTRQRSSGMQALVIVLLVLALIVLIGVFAVIMSHTSKDEKSVAPVTRRDVILMPYRSALVESPEQLGPRPKLPGGAMLFVEGGGHRHPCLGTTLCLTRQKHSPA